MFVCFNFIANKYTLTLGRGTNPNENAPTSRTPPENLCNSDKSSNSVSNDDTINNTGFTMMHPAFQNQNSNQHNQKILDNNLSTSSRDNENDKSEKIYTELKLYKNNNDDRHFTNSNHCLNSSSRICNTNTGNGSTSSSSTEIGINLNHNNNNNNNSESDGSDSEEIDLTSGSCIDFSNNNKNHSVQ